MDLIANTYEYLWPGGPVMIPIILTSFCMWLLIVERVLYFRRMDKDDVSLKQAVQMLNQRPLQTASKGLRARVVMNFLKERTKNKKLDPGILKLCAMRERPHIRQFLTVIAVLAAISPLFGLLGTVTGMITTFNVIALFGTGNAKAMAGGISEALITTQSGLLVAIPGLFMSAFLIRRANRLESRLDELIMTLKRNV
ncbi:MAG: MotA/TolQ/ExbB proton channel family protein [Deltaproteobacteria bacterium]|nr:MotA/TolQ/ExbB proton channel family protein [Deltaproteobacteria bacterium]